MVITLICIGLFIIVVASILNGTKIALEAQEKEIKFKNEIAASRLPQLDEKAKKFFNALFPKGYIDSDAFAIKLGDHDCFVTTTHRGLYCINLKTADDVQLDQETLKALASLCEDVQKQNEAQMELAKRKEILLAIGE